MAADILLILVKMNLAAAAAVLLTLLLRKPARKAFGARLAYALWLIVPLAAAATLVPARKVVLALPVEAVLALPVQGLIEQAPPPAVSTPALIMPEAASLALGLWLVGLIAFGLLLIWRQHRFMQDLQVIRAEDGYLRAAASEAGPMVVGALRPRIVLPTDFETRFDPRERDVVLAHETAHLAAGDTRINALVAVAQCVAWFNPLIHVAARYMRLDQELACDAAVLAARPDDRQLYATALLKAQTHSLPLPVGCYWPAGAHPLKERIIMMKSQSPSRLRALAGSAIVTSLCIGAAAAAWAVQPAQVVMQTKTAPALSFAAPQASAVTAESSPLTASDGKASAVRPQQLAQATTTVRAGSPSASPATAQPPPPRPTQITPRPPAILPAIAIPAGSATHDNSTTTVANGAETPLSLLTKSASATSREDCLKLFPSLTNGTNAEKTQRMNEQVTCLNQWNDAAPSLLRQYMNSQQGAGARFDYRVSDTMTTVALSNRPNQSQGGGTRSIVIPKTLTAAGKAQILQQLDAELARTTAGPRRDMLLTSREGLIQTPTRD